MAEQKNASNLPALPADLPENWTYGQIVSPNGTEAGLTPKHGYNYLMRQVNQAQALLNQVTAMIQSEMATQDYVDAAINGRVPTTRKVNGKALSGDISLTAADVGALGKTETAAAATKLATSRTIRTNLASTSSSSFNGTANITPGVTGTLGIGNGGTGATTAAAARTNLGVGLGKRTARFTVGTSTAGWTANDCDYLCDGTADEVQINAAIQALPSGGGEVVILDGTYNLTGSVLVNKANVTLTGNGANTVLKRRAAGTESQPGLIHITARDNTICFLFVDGAGVSGTYNDGISIVGDGVVYRNTIHGVQIYNNSRYGIYSVNAPRSVISENYIRTNGYGIFFRSGDNTIACNIIESNSGDGIHTSSTTNNIVGNICLSNKQHGIYVSDGNNTVTGNSCVGNSRSGIHLYAAFDVVVSGNDCFGNGYNGIYAEYRIARNVFSGNTCSSNNFYGIYLGTGDSMSNTITGNICNNNADGICLDRCANTVVSGNTCTRGTGTSANYTSDHHTILVQSGSTNNLIIGNMIMGKNYTNNGGSTNTFANNKYN